MKFLKILLLVLIFSFGVTALAQDGTVEATLPAEVVATEEPVSDVTIINEAPEENPGEPETSQEFTLAALLDFGKWLAGIAFLLVAGRALLRRADAWLAIKQTDVNFMSRGEGAAAWTPAAIKDNLTGFVDDGLKVGKRLQDILAEWVDNEPYAAKQGMANVTKKLPEPPNS